MALSRIVLSLVLLVVLAPLPLHAFTCDQVRWAKRNFSAAALEKMAAFYGATEKDRAAAQACLEDKRAPHAPVPKPRPVPKAVPAAKPAPPRVETPIAAPEPALPVPVAAEAPVIVAPPPAAVPPPPPIATPGPPALPLPLPINQPERTTTMLSLILDMIPGAAMIGACWLAWLGLKHGGGALLKKHALAAEASAKAKASALLGDVGPRLADLEKKVTSGLEQRLAALEAKAGIAPPAPPAA